MYHIAQVIWGYIQLHHEAILALAVPGGAGLAVIIQFFLHKFKIDGAKLSFTVSNIFAAATAVSAYFLDSVHPNAGVTYAWVWVASQFWHRFAVNPAYNKYVLPFLDWLAKQKIAGAATPPAVATGIPAAAGDSLE